GLGGFGVARGRQRQAVDQPVAGAPARLRRQRLGGSEQGRGVVRRQQQGGGELVRLLRGGLDQRRRRLDRRGDSRHVRLPRAVGQQVVAHQGVGRLPVVRLPGEVVGEGIHRLVRRQQVRDRQRERGRPPLALVHLAEVLSEGVRAAAVLAD